MTTKKNDDDCRILKTMTCPSLSGRSELKAEYSYHDPSKAIMFRIAENTGAGHFCDHWVSLDDILKCLKGAKEPFSLNVFKALYPSHSQNNFGFLGAVMCAEDIIVCNKRKYLKKDTKPFLADLNKLIKPTSKSPTRKPTKTAVKEAPK